MKNQLFLFIMLLPSVTMSQSSFSENKKGIQWTEGLTWEQVKQKAKQEDKYIFIDAFTTWCGPCKLMDKNIYTNDTVGIYFNKNFISLKIQMDKSIHDNEYTKSWYSDAAALAKLFRIEGYPSFIFLSPQGKIIHKEMGYQTVKEFMIIAQTATRVGKVYNDKYADYDRLVADYKQGLKDYSKMSYMISTAYRFDDIDLGKQLLEEHTEYVKKLSPKKRYKKENVEMWSGFILNSNSPRFRFFYKDGKRIDNIMNQKGYSRAVVDRTIQREVVDSFFRMQQGETMLITGKKVKNNELMTLGNLPKRTDGKIVSDKAEADWKMLYQMIRQKFSKKAAKRNVLSARINWYKQHSNYTAAAKYTLKQFRKQMPILTPSNVYIINYFAWDVFSYVSASERKIMSSTLIWTNKAIRITPTDMSLLDTYANLLYKTGRKEAAILWEEKAYNTATKQNAERIAKGQTPLKGGRAPEHFQKVAEQMKRGEKTYLKEGALWN